MLVATAGHIDHGKSALVRALTGVDTDRLPEERARGISIDLGFAYWRPDPAGPTIGFVDVPGHERFIGNMLAGLAGIRFAVIVVAADDGVMPQTVEHVRILDLLGVRRGVVAITKCDRADGARIDAVRGETAELLATTGLAGAEAIATSAVSGQGLVELGQALRTAAAGSPAPPQGRHVRMAIDRAFTVAGAGTVVTGTVLAGSIAVGSDLLVAPGGTGARVRTIQSAGRSVAMASDGERCALNLAGVALGDVGRGDWLVAPAMHAPTRRLAVRLQVLRERAAPLRHQAPLHLHHGARRVGARLLIPCGRALAPGDEAIVHLALDQPVSAVAGERFVVRDPSGRALIGGGTILDPLAGDDRRLRARDRLAFAAAIDPAMPAASLRNLLAIPGHEVGARWLERAFNLTGEAAAAARGQAEAIAVGRSGDLLLPRSRFAALGEAALNRVARHHRDHPEGAGPSPRELRLALPEPVSTEAFHAVLKALAEEGRLVPGGPTIRLPGHAPRFGADETALWHAVLALDPDDPPRALITYDLARRLRTPEPLMRAMLNRRRIAGELWSISETRFMRREHVARLAAVAAFARRGRRRRLHCGPVPRRRRHRPQPGDPAARVLRPDRRHRPPRRRSRGAGGFRRDRRHGRLIARPAATIAFTGGALAAMTPAMATAAQRSVFGTLPDGREVAAVTLRNDHGISVTVLAYGALIQALDVPDRQGRAADVVLGHADLTGYLDQPAYFGATVGRYANRIAGGRFILDGTDYQLACNDGAHALHGGPAGFDKRLWSVAEVRADADAAAVTFTYTSADGEEGYPGTLAVSATYRLDANDALAIDYRATTDRPTIVNLTSHSYFNLAGEGTGDVYGHRLTIPAAAFTPVDSGLIPVGELRAVAGTPFDFRRPAAVGERIGQADEQLRKGRGYDHNWAIAERAAAEVRLHARVEEPASGRVLEVWSNQPGLQFYSGNVLDATIAGKSGRAYRQGDGLCLEPQLFPDTPNQPAFGSARLAPGEVYRHRIVYRFSAGSDGRA